MSDSERKTPRPRRDISGIFNIDKPSGMTSHDVVARVRRISGQRKAGHAGTLDPIATGVLPVVLGKATRLVEYLADADKAYRAVVMLGATSDTYDREGNITPTPDALMPSHEQVEEALEQFRGEIEQLPPMHSAIKVGGKKLYELARAGVEVERQTRHVTIKKLELEVFNPPEVQIFVECSKGTYIRSLAHDVGNILGIGAYLQDLTRTQHGPFSIEGAITLEGLEAAFREDTWHEALYPPEYILRGWRTHTATPEEELAIRQGKVLPLPAPARGEGEMLAANTADGELLAVLYWDRKREVWQPKKVFPAGG
ncbi:MAG: tRNA pseudouridine(55) synthase TruB [Chloroflexota bacterium]|nr:tRNA pseudouridine(55) synthase TruB [Chloroflexota bacterium]